MKILLLNNMTWLYRCDSCDKVIYTEKWAEIQYPKNEKMYRCQDCVKKKGLKPESKDFIAFKRFRAAIGLEDLKYVVPYHPKKFPCDMLSIIKEKNKLYW